MNDKHQRFPEWSWRSFRRNWWRTSGEVWKEIFELLLLGKSSEAFSTKTPPHISPSIFTTRFWVVAGPTITPNKFWGFNKRNSQENYSTLSCPDQKYYTIFHTNSFTPKYSQGISWRNKFTSVTPENSWGISCVILAGPMVDFTKDSSQHASAGMATRTVWFLYTVLERKQRRMVSNSFRERKNT